MKSTDVTQIANTSVFYADFKNNGSRNLNTNGSVTPLEFTLEDVVNEKFILTRVDFIISCGDALELTKFGSIAELTNGIELHINNSIINLMEE